MGQRVTTMMMSRSGGSARGSTEVREGDSSWRWGSGQSTFSIARMGGWGKESFGEFALGDDRRLAWGGGNECRWSWERWYRQVLADASISATFSSAEWAMNEPG
jgi:hypothetical protein